MVGACCEGVGGEVKEPSVGVAEGLGGDPFWLALAAMLWQSR